MSELDPKNPQELNSASAQPEEASTQALAEALHSSFKIVKWVLVGLVVMFFCSGVFTVGPQEKAVILRLGTPVGHGQEALLGAGLHWAYPYPIDEVIKIPSVQVQTATSSTGWYSGPDNQFGGSLRPEADGYTLTGDGNIIHVRATLRYRISDPIQFYFGFIDGPNMVTNALNNAIFFASAQFPVDRALRTDLTGFKEMILNRVNDLIRVQNLGITLEPSDVVALAPRQTKADFEAVISQEQARNEAINKAQGEADEILAKVAGESNAIVNFALGESNRVVSEMEARATNFNSILPLYRKNPQLFAQHMQVEALRQIYTNVQYKFFVPERANGKPWELRVQLNRAIRKNAATNNPTSY